MTSPSDKNDLLASKAKEALSPLRHGIPEVSPYLKTRVLAHLESAQPASSARLGWFSFRWAGAFLGAAAVATVFATSILRESSYPAVLAQPVAVRVDMKDFKARGVSHARVELSKDVHFYSQKFPEIQAKTALDLNWKEGLLPSTLPIVVKSDERGMKTVRVKFFNDENRVVAERVLKIKFESPGHRSSSDLVERG